MSISITTIQYKNAYNFYHRNAMAIYEIDNKKFMFGQSEAQGNKHFIQEILPDGRLGDTTESGSSPIYYDYATILEDGNKKYLCCINTSSAAIQLLELTPDGKTKLVFADNYSQDGFETFIPYMNNGVLFAYRQNEASKRWEIVKLEQKNEL
ncbi:hypothetical protein KKJ06_16420 [Xenorhabdus bovienii]|uniref:Uncharacterized protein n=2 Tax=Xenorhabdus bovienii TaxID=40576 RepID=A0A077QL80_XENBV|nr:hypothetical protein [Xenorhabdus bovienii]MDE1474903.1 hypothetical protein [Xenorhabdus bovienii]MDE1480712.1 hypothetical protein [Xenorhabdus bovienii]MDE1489173.1 hypothetical protein [Xenorhabdus bovienii]MDE1493227.1 hypothetical protein [Xenorhabdus bovienii]MDE1497030.1 hypothetical protein [Xenorhabdus bovienii]